MILEVLKERMRLKEHVKSVLQRSRPALSLPWPQHPSTSTIETRHGRRQPGRLWIGCNMSRKTLGILSRLKSPPGTRFGRGSASVDEADEQDLCHWFSDPAEWRSGVKIASWKGICLAMAEAYGRGKETIISKTRSTTPADSSGGVPRVLARRLGIAIPLDSRWTPLPQSRSTSVFYVEVTVLFTHS